VSCRKICKHWRNGFFKSLKILFCAESKSGELFERYIPFSIGASTCACRQKDYSDESMAINLWSSAKPWTKDTTN
jgi:hypothetical protein